MLAKKIKKSNFYKIKKVFQIDYIDVNKILFSKIEPYGTKNSFKYFTGYNNVVRPLCVRLSQMTGYARKCDENVTMSSKANNKQLLKNYNKIWEKVEKLMKIDFESKPVYCDDDDKYIKTKMKICTGSMITNLLIEKAPCLPIMLGSVIKANKKYYPQTLRRMQIHTIKDKN